MNDNQNPKPSQDPFVITLQGDKPQSSPVPNQAQSPMGQPMPPPPSPMGQQPTAQQPAPAGPPQIPPHIAQDPQAAFKYLIDTGMTALKSQNWQVALDHLAQAVLLSDQTPMLWDYLGMCAVNLGKFEAAYLYITRLLWLNPEQVTAHLNRGRVASKLHMYDEAIEDFEWVLASKDTPNNQKTDAGIELLSIYREMAQTKDDMKKALKVIEVLENIPDEDLGKQKGRFFRHRIFTYLKMGDYKKGFDLYEGRNDPNLKLHSQVIWADLPHHVPEKFWDGKADIKDKVLLIAAEQGFGDMVQFIRLLPDFHKLLQKKGVKKIILEAYPQLVSLCQSSPCCKDVEVIARGADVNMDYWMKIGSLPYHVGVTIDKIPNADKKTCAYIAVSSPPKPLLKKIAGRRRIGVTWSSNTNSFDTSLRSLKSLRQLLPLWDVDDCDFYSLQIGERAKEIYEVGMEAALLDLSPYIKDFSDTARFIKELDLVITIDSAVMHVTGALGKPVWVMAPYASDWRLGLEKFLTPYASPWYPTSKIFRCQAPGRWEEVVEMIRDELVKN